MSGSALANIWFCSVGMQQVVSTFLTITMHMYVFHSFINLANQIYRPVSLVYALYGLADYDM